MIHIGAFYLFAFLVLASGVLTITARNPVHSVLWLILAFFSAAGLFVLLGAEFLAMLLVIVYVGAVMVLFLFVVMMLDVDFVRTDHVPSPRQISQPFEQCKQRLVPLRREKVGHGQQRDRTGARWRDAQARG